MVASTPLMRQAFIQPLAHDVCRDMQFLRQFIWGVQHWQKTGRMDNDSMGQAIFHKRVLASQVEFCLLLQRDFHYYETFDFFDFGLRF